MEKITLHVTSAGKPPPTIVGAGVSLRDRCRSMVDDVPESGLDELLEDIVRIVEFYTERQAYLQKKISPAIAMSGGA